MRWALALIAVAACSQDSIAVVAHGGADHNRAALLAAARTCRAAGSTMVAFGAFSREVLRLREGMDETIAQEAELLLLALALDVVEPVPGAATGADGPMLTVWPIGLSPRMTAPVPGRPAADAWGDYLPGPDEDPLRYTMRLCGAQLARDCGKVVPEGQAAVVAALAIGRFTDRVRAAASTCVTCDEVEWGKRVARWEALDRAAVSYVEPARRRMAVSRWPAAGPGAVAVPPGPTLTVEDDFTLDVDGEVVSPTSLPAFMAAARRESGATVLRMHLAPSAPSEWIQVALNKAGEAGFRQVAVEARVLRYPWPLVAYVLDVGGTIPIGVRGSPVQLLTRELDARSAR